MITSTILHLQAQTNGRIHGSTGRAVHGFWFRQWQHINPAIADALHQAKDAMPFTLSPLMGLPPPQRGTRRIKAGAEAWLRVTTLRANLSQSLLETWLPRLPAQIELAGIPWTVKQICLSPQEHPWARQSTYQELDDRWHSDPDPLQKWPLSFVTPTTFHSGPNIHLPFPLPDSLVASWARRWQAFSPIPLRADIRSKIRETVRISAYDLKTVPVRHDRRLTIGCVGKMTLSTGVLSPGERAILTMLADYAFYAGSGHRTTQGMGMTRMTIGDRQFNRQS